MPRVIVMDRELHEPLTLIELPIALLKAIADGSHPSQVRFPIPQTLSFNDFLAGGAAACMALSNPMDTTLEFQAVHEFSGGRREVMFWFAYARDPEMALQLRAAFLPGQLSEVQRRERVAFWRGAFATVRL